MLIVGDCWCMVDHIANVVKLRASCARGLDVLQQTAPLFDHGVVIMGMRIGRRKGHWVRDMQCIVVLISYEPCRGGQLRVRRDADLVGSVVFIPWICLR